LEIAKKGDERRGDAGKVIKKTGRRSMRRLTRMVKKKTNVHLGEGQCSPQTRVSGEKTS